MTTMRALQEAYDYRREVDYDDDNAEYRKSVLVEVAENSIVDATKAGINIGIPTKNYLGAATHYPLTSYLGECGHDAQDRLLEACKHALNGDAASAALVLRKFVDQVAKDYGADNWELFA